MAGKWCSVKSGEWLRGRFCSRCLPWEYSLSITKSDARSNAPQQVLAQRRSFCIGYNHYYIFVSTFPHVFVTCYFSIKMIQKLQCHLFTVLFSFICVSSVCVRCVFVCLFVFEGGGGLCFIRLQRVVFRISGLQFGPSWAHTWTHWVCIWSFRNPLWTLEALCGPWGLPFGP